MRLDILSAIRKAAAPHRPAPAPFRFRAAARFAAVVALVLSIPRAVADDLPWCGGPAREETHPTDAHTTADSAPPEADVDVEPSPAVGRDVWSVITRGLPAIGGMPRQVRPAVERLDADGRWRNADLDGLLSTPGQPLLVFVHGNRFDHASAREHGLLLAARTGAICPDAADVRTVIFSWPSDQQGILLRDIRAKYDRAVTEGHYLAWFLSHVEPDRPVAIVGYSYGSLIALEALEDLVHAEWAGRSDIRPWINRSAPLHVVLVAAAVRQDAFAPRGPYREILPCIDRLTNLSNSADIPLRFFEHVDRSLRTKALGHVGMPGRWIPPGTEFRQIDCSRIVGHSHRLTNYLESSTLMRRICIDAGRGLCDGETDPGIRRACGDSRGTAAAEDDLSTSPCPCGR